MAASATPSYRVADDVQNHSAIGTGYLLVLQPKKGLQDIRLESGIQAPNTPGVSVPGR